MAKCTSGYMQPGKEDAISCHRHEVSKKRVPKGKREKDKLQHGPKVRHRKKLMESQLMDVSIGKRPPEDSGVDGRIILKRSLKIWVEKA